MHGSHQSRRSSRSRQVELLLLCGHEAARSADLARLVSATDRSHGSARGTPTDQCRRPVATVHWCASRYDDRIYPGTRPFAAPRDCRDRRSEEHTSELQSLMRISYAVFCLKKKKNKKTK